MILFDKKTPQTAEFFDNRTSFGDVSEIVVAFDKIRQTKTEIYKITPLSNLAVRVLRLV